MIGFVSGNGFIEKDVMNGLRKCLADEFSNIYVLNLRGDIRKNMLSKGKAQEGHNVFGSGSMTGIAITLFIKNPLAQEHGHIYYHDIGDNKTKEEKLSQIIAFKSIGGIAKANGWLPITPDKHNDWVGQRDDSFTEFISLGDKKDKNAITIFDSYSMGIKTNRDAWVYNFSKYALIQNMEKMIGFYNQEVKRYENTCIGKLKSDYPDVEDFINPDSTKISWSRALRAELGKFKIKKFNLNSMTSGLYRPFCKTHLFFNRDFINDVALMPRIFPDSKAENMVICVCGKGSRNGFSTFICNILPDLNILEAGTQCFPLKLYEKNSSEEELTEADDGQKDMFASPDPSYKVKSEGEYTIKDGISDEGLAYFQTAYPKETITKEDVFYYIYGLLHSADYKKRYADNLSKEFPRIPCVKKADDFWAFSKAGRDLAELHINYESVAPYPVIFAGGELFMDSFKDKDYRVEQMKFGKKGKVTDKTTVIYNNNITMTNIPLPAYDYVVNGKPALEWVMERQAVTTHKDSGIVNDANLWAIETMQDAAYPLKLFQRVITVSLETMKIVRALPRLDIAASQS